MKYNIPDNIKKRFRFLIDLTVADRIKRTAQEGIPFWIASFITGVVAISYAWLFGYTEDLMQRILSWNDWMIFVLAPICFLLAWLCVRIFARNAKGSGIPQVMAAIELSNPRTENKVGKLLSLRIMVTKIVSSLLMVLGGGAIGREGPTIQIAGSIFRMVNKIIPTSWPKLAGQSFILTGAAAGLAAAFNTPLGGVVFAMEELAKIHIRYFRTALFSAVIIAGLTAQALAGPYLYIGYPDVKSLKFTIFFGVIATAIVAGILGGLMGRIIIKVMSWKRALGLLKNLLFVLFAGLLMASLAYFVNDAILGSGKELMNDALFTETKKGSWHTILMRIIGPVVCFNTGAAGGIFAPALAAGASVGTFIAELFDLAGSNANILILSGMVGFLTGITRTPFTCAILVLEMTDRHSVIFHLMLAAMFASIAALLIDKRSFYEHLKNDYVKDVMSEKK